MTFSFSPAPPPSAFVEIHTPGTSAIAQAGLELPVSEFLSAEMSHHTQKEPELFLNIVTQVTKQSL